MAELHIREIDGDALAMTPIACMWLADSTVTGIAFLLHELHKRRRES